MTVIPALLLQDESAGPGALTAFAGTTFFVIFLAIFAIAIVAGWRVFTKAGQPGWAVIVPIYNIYILCEIAGRPGWWVVLFLIPLVNIVISLLLAIDIAKSFGRSPAFGVILLWLLGGIGYLILAFGSDRYVGPAGAGLRERGYAAPA